MPPFPSSQHSQSSSCSEVPATPPWEHFLPCQELSPPSAPPSPSVSRSLKFLLPPAGTASRRPPLQPFVGDRAPSALRLRGACYTASQLPSEAWEASQSRLLGASHPRGLAPAAVLSYPHSTPTGQTAAAAGVRFMWMPWGFCKEKRVCVHKEGRKPTFIKVLLCGGHIHKHHFRRPLGPGRSICLEGHCEDEIGRST